MWLVLNEFQILQFLAGASLLGGAKATVRFRFDGSLGLILRAEPNDPAGSTGSASSDRAFTGWEILDIARVVFDRDNCNIANRATILILEKAPMYANNFPSILKLYSLVLRLTSNIYRVLLR